MAKNTGKDADEILDDLLDVEDGPEQDARVASRGNVARTRNADDPRVATGRAHAREERQEELDDLDDIVTDFTFDVLPNLPQMDGFHLVWLSTTNQQDPIYRREQMGYEPVTPEMFGEQGFKLRSFAMKSGDYPGVISINEMLLYRISQRRYEAVMNHFHEKQPLDSEAAIREGAEQMIQQSGGEGKIIAEGFNELGRPTDRPVW